MLSGLFLLYVQGCVKEYYMAYVRQRFQSRRRTVKGSFMTGS